MFSDCLYPFVDHTITSFTKNTISKKSLIVNIFSVDNSLIEIYNSLNERSEGVKTMKAKPETIERVSDKILNKLPEEARMFILGYAQGVMAPRERPEKPDDEVA